MARIKTQEDFIKKAIDIHGDKYDYSEVVYVKSDCKVRIICPEHGVFEQTPNKHLSGQGCKLCGHNRTRMGFDEFVRRAREVHGMRYDYSKVKYVRKDVPVIIRCRVHGDFEQTPHCHITLGQNCPKCSAISGGRKRMGDNNAMRKESVRQKAQNTCIERYGTKTYAESLAGRARLHDIITSVDVGFRMRETCMGRYGAKTWSQSDVGHRKLHEIMSSEQMRDKIRSGYISNYGVSHYMKTEAGREIARKNMSLPERRNSIRQSFMAKYGVPNALLISAVHEKGWKTKRDNGTCNTSKPEETLYLLLCDVFGASCVFRQYNLDSRYPFNCDFYINFLDVFIELNASWTHGGHWFDETNPLDIERLLSWSDKCVGLNSRYYKCAIHTWTVRDVMKRQRAIDNNLNYLVFWDNDLTDAKLWLSQFTV